MMQERKTSECVPVLTCAESATCETEEKHTRQLCLHLDGKSDKDENKDPTLKNTPEEF